MITIPFTSIIREDRVRRDYGDIEELAESLWTKGFIHPLCIDFNNNLIAGGRRSAAIDHMIAHKATMQKELGDPCDCMAELVHGGTLRFGIHFTHKTVESLDQLSELELIENVQRKQMTWQEECLSIAKTHKLKQRQGILGGDPWGQKETGRLFNVSQASINNALFFAKHLTNDDSPLWKAASATEAMQILAKEKHDEVQAALARSIKTRASALPTNILPDLDGSIITNFDVSSFSVAGTAGFDPSSEYSDSPRPAETKSVSNNDSDEAFSIALSIVHHCDAIDFFKKLGPASVDHVITDPPYAIDMKNLKQQNQGQADIDRIAHTHDVDDNLSNFEAWLTGCYDILKDKGFCVWFCDAMHFRMLHDLGVKVGFKVQRWPFHWIKTSPCLNQKAEFNFTKTVEHAIVFRKENSRLVSPQSSNIWSGQLSSEDKEEGVNHPFIKPLCLWQHLFKAIALPGATIADPFSGVGSMPMAALRAGYQPVTCEIDEKHYNQQIQNLARTYLNIKTGMYEDDVLY
tara:strand:+ start:2963 stop:4516 length:1554 start_codon:yes stop_codon:yes gene_type:complete